ncbi:MAG: ZIP family metal transporter [Gammaproteobacteria bacterium]|nr:ZIP family metal transporter [Gammaproteobacteria bacterium]
MDLLIWILIFSLLGGALSVLVASVFLLIPTVIRDRLLPHSVSFAIGALLGAAFLALLPHAISHPSVRDVHDLTTTVLVGLLIFFVLEKMVLWRHCHSHDCEAHTQHGHKHNHQGMSSTMMILIGDGLHNFVDGILIAAAFMTDFHLGVVTALAVAAHEIPQEVGDFIVLLNSGMRRGKALMLNLLSSLSTVVGALLAYFGLSDNSLIPYVLAIAASSFIYIAVADLIPGLHKRSHPLDSLKQLVLIMSGILVISMAHSTLH